MCNTVKVSGAEADGALSKAGIRNHGAGWDLRGDQKALKKEKKRKKKKINQRWAAVWEKPSRSASEHFILRKDTKTTEKASCD